MRVDLKSVFFGMALILALFIVIGQTSKISERMGRYQIVMPQNTDENPFLIDTQTGKALRFYRNREGNVEFRWGREIVPMDSITTNYFWGSH